MGSTALSNDGNTRRTGSKTQGVQATVGSLDTTSDALSESRRIYVGNLLYHIRPKEISDALEAEGCDGFEQIHISMDPVTGRNPGYCFVEFTTREMANLAIETMSGVSIQGRRLKTGPCEPKRPARGGGGGSDPNFDRWGDWNSRDIGARLDGQGPQLAEEHFVDVVEANQCSRVFVGGLGKMINQEYNNTELREIFQGFSM